MVKEQRNEQDERAARRMITTLLPYKLWSAHELDALAHGRWVSGRQGRGLHFRSLRPAAPDEPVHWRDIDGPASRVSGERMVRTYYADVATRVGVLVDCSAGMYAGKKMYRAAVMAGALAESARGFGDRVSVACVRGDTVMPIADRFTADGVSLYRSLLRLSCPVPATRDPYGIAVGRALCALLNERVMPLFILSDFAEVELWEEPLGYARGKTILLPVVIRQPIEEDPSIVRGAFVVRDPVSRGSALVSLLLPRSRKRIGRTAAERNQYIAAVLRQSARREPLVYGGATTVEEITKYFRIRRM